MRAKGTVILPDGTTCSGKTTYSRRLQKERGAVLFVIDEIFQRVGPTTAPPTGEEPASGPEMMAAAISKILEFVRETAVQIANAGVDVILESGYFNKAERDEMRAYFTERGVPCEWHYLDVSDETWRRNIAARNAAHAAGEVGTFYIGEAEIAMFVEYYQPPERGEVDVWIDNNR